MNYMDFSLPFYAPKYVILSDKLFVMLISVNTIAEVSSFLFLVYFSGLCFFESFINYEEGNDAKSAIVYIVSDILVIIVTYLQRRLSLMFLV